MAPHSLQARIGIIGPHRRREGTGPHVARYLHRAGAVVAAVTAATFGSAAEAAEAMSGEFGYKVMPYGTPRAMMDNAALDAVAICSPARCHEVHLTDAAQANIPVFCEKPLVWSGRPGDSGRAAELVRKFKEKRLVLHYNTQWRFVLEDIVGLLGSQRVFGANRFEMSLAPPVPGLEMIPDAAPHPISLITVLGGIGTFSKFSGRWAADRTGLQIDAMAPRLGRDALAVRMVFHAKRSQPRPAWIALDSSKIERVVISMSPYRLALRMGGLFVPIVDPLDRSVRSFLDRLVRPNHRAEPRIEVEMAMLEEVWGQMALLDPVADGSHD